MRTKQRVCILIHHHWRLALLQLEIPNLNDTSAYQQHWLIRISPLSILNCWLIFVPLHLSSNAVLQYIHRHNMNKYKDNTCSYVAFIHNCVMVGRYVYQRGKVVYKTSTTHLQLTICTAHLQSPLPLSDQTNSLSPTTSAPVNNGAITK